MNVGRMTVWTDSRFVPGNRLVLLILGVDDDRNLLVYGDGEISVASEYSAFEQVGERVLGGRRCGWRRVG